MGKHEVGTPKYIANKMKAKGLQKLQWYCQMCHKQCRDENGFKCHTMSEGHHRQLLLFADNASKYMNQFSREFSDGYLNVLKRQFGTRRVAANRVYQEYIADRTHIHMNSTIWLSLTAYVKWLGRKGKCVVDETEKGWFVTYIDREPETLAALEKKAKREKMDKNDDERMQDFIEKQVQKGSKESNCRPKVPTLPLMRSEGDGPLVLQIKVKPKVKPIMGPPLALSKKSDLSQSKIDNEPLHSENNKRSREPSETRSHRQLKGIDSNGEPSTKRERRYSENKNISTSETQGWLQEGLIVEIVTKSLGQKYYKAKGIIQAPVLEAGFVSKIKLIFPEDVKGHVVKIDQEHLETVIPAIGREVLIIQGKYEGCKATVQKVRTDEYCVDVEIIKDKKYVKRIGYELVCKIDS